MAASAGCVAAGCERQQGGQRFECSQDDRISLASLLLAVGATGQGVGAGQRGACVVEADDTFFLRSNKGQHTGNKSCNRGGRASRKARGMDLIPILVARDRSGATADFLLEAVSKACLNQALLSRTQSDAALCTDDSEAMATAAKELQVQHEAVNLSVGKRLRGPWHNQNANAYHDRLKAWLARFKGVGTSYLESNLGWFQALDRAIKNTPKMAPMLALAVGLGSPQTG